MNQHMCSQLKGFRASTISMYDASARSGYFQNVRLDIELWCEGVRWFLKAFHLPSTSERAWNDSYDESHYITDVDTSFTKLMPEVWEEGNFYVYTGWHLKLGTMEKVRGKTVVHCESFYGFMM